MSLTSSLLTTSIANVYVSTGNSAVTTMYFTNYSDSANAMFTLYAVSSGQSASNTNKIYSNLLVEPGDTYVIDSERLLLGGSDSLQSSANTNSVLSVTLSYTSL